MKKPEVELFLKTQAQALGAYEEIAALSKKSPNDAVNKFKLNLINQIFKEANSLLTGKYKPIPDFELFDPDAIPTNSDVAFVLSQYLKCLETLRSDNISMQPGYRWFWVIDGQVSELKTAAPRSLQGETV